MMGPTDYHPKRIPTKSSALGMQRTEKYHLMDQTRQQAQNVPSPDSYKINYGYSAKYPRSPHFKPGKE